MRPGSVIGKQQHCLCAVEEACRRELSGAAAGSERRISAAAICAEGRGKRVRLQSVPKDVEPSVLAAQVSACMVRRAASAVSSRLRRRKAPATARRSKHSGCARSCRLGPAMNM